MNKSETQPTERIGTIVRSVDDLMPGLLYRLHIHWFDPEEGSPRVEVENFYVVDSGSGVVSHEGLVPVEKVKGNGTRERSSYGLSDLGIDIGKSPPSPNELAWSNWVEQVPEEEPTPKKP